MKFTKQSPIFLEDEHEHYSVFTSEAPSISGYTTIRNNSEVYIQYDKLVKLVPATQYLKSRTNPFVAMCMFMGNVKTMTFENCNLFKRSFTTKGIGFTFNNEIEEKLIKKEFYSTALFPNTKRNPSLMKSTSSEHSLMAIIENNAEEVQRYENTVDSSGQGDESIKPKRFSVSLHNPREPADIRSKSFTIPLGQSTTVYITPKAREIDESGGELTESQRNCRLDDDTEALEIFSAYTRAGCMFECRMKHSVEHCGCVPWNYPISIKEKVSIVNSCRFYLIVFLIGTTNL